MAMIGFLYAGLGIAMQVPQAQQLSIKNILSAHQLQLLPLLYPAVIPQGSVSSCGSHSVINAKAIQNIVQSNTPIDPNNVQRLSKDIINEATEIIINTATSEQYKQFILEKLREEKQRLSHSLSQQEANRDMKIALTQTQPNLLKDLLTQIDQINNNILELSERIQTVTDHIKRTEQQADVCPIRHDISDVTNFAQFLNLQNYTFIEKSPIDQSLSWVDNQNLRHPFSKNKMVSLIHPLFNQSAWSIFFICYEGISGIFEAGGHWFTIAIVKEVGKNPVMILMDSQNANIDDYQPFIQQLHNAAMQAIQQLEGVTISPEVIAGGPACPLLPPAETDEEITRRIQEEERLTAEMLRKEQEEQKRQAEIKASEYLAQQLQAEEKYTAARTQTAPSPAPTVPVATTGQARAEAEALIAQIAARTDKNSQLATRQLRTMLNNPLYRIQDVIESAKSFLERYK